MPSTSKANQPYEVIRALLDANSPQNEFTLSLSDFKIVYREIQKRFVGVPIDIVMNGDWAAVQFTGIHNHRIRVVSDYRSKRLARALGYRQYLEEKDFEIAASSATIYGARQPLSLSLFVREEADANKIRGPLIFFATGILLMILTKSSASLDSMSTANDLLVGIASIFFTIFMLFTASQNLPVGELQLFKSGLSHRFVQVDMWVARMAILALAVAVVNRVLVAGAIVPNSNASVQAAPLPPDWAINLVPWTTAIGVVLMATCLFAVVDYYLKRTRNLFEHDLSKQVLDEVYNAKSTKASTNGNSMTK